jgi:hypothetical protein
MDDPIVDANDQATVEWRQRHASEEMTAGSPVEGKDPLYMGHVAGPSSWHDP